MRARKIGLIGSAGLGKSSVAADVSARSGLVFLKSKDITRPILDKYGYDYARCECVEKFLSRKEIEFEIVCDRIMAEEVAGEFITDRTTLECFAYALLNVEKYEDEEIRRLEEMCRGNLSNYTELFYFSYRNGWLEENGVRTMSGYFQWKMDMLIRGLINDWGLKNVMAVEGDPVAQIMKVIGVDPD